MPPDGTQARLGSRGVPCGAIPPSPHDNRAPPRLRRCALSPRPMEVTIANNVMTIRIPCAANPAPSKSGKTRLVATTNGNVKTAAMVAGKPVTIGLNAYIPIS